MDFMQSVLVVGSGAREHAIVKALLRSDRPLCIYAWPGNPGMENDGCMLIDRTIDGWNDLADWAFKNSIELTIVGPEQPLVEGIVDIFLKKQLTVFGPSKAAAQIEGSKAFAKDLMKKYGIPTAAFETFTTKNGAMKYIDKVGVPIVVKASGLAAGKGAIVCETREEAEKALVEMFDKKVFGDAGTTVVLEEKMKGEEASIFVLTDGKDYKFLPVSQDHKRIGDNDSGPNTGGMGAYAPAPVVDDTMLGLIEQTIIKPTIEAMRAEGATFRGLLYCGVMLTEQGPRVVEFNCRFGDPETEAVLPLIECDWYELFQSCATGKLASVKWNVKKESCVTVVLASKGYPGNFEKGKEISGIEDVERSRTNVDVYFSGVACNDEGKLVTNGGRVLAVTTWAETLHDAILMAYDAISGINFEGKTMRNDIGAKGLARKSKL